jgi:hypothetical protein
LNHFETNANLLSIRQPALASRLRQAKSAQVKLHTSACGLPTACWEHNASSLALHSRYDPLKEARHTIAKYDCTGADYFVFLGFGLGYLLDALLERHADPSNHYFVVESELSFLRAAFEARDLSSILSLPHLHFAWPITGAELAEQWQRFFDPVYAQKSIFISHPPSMTLNAAAYKAATEMIQSQTFQIFTDINTLVSKSQTFLDNFALNIVKAARAPGVAKFAGNFAGVPAVIVSAGPSLDRNIHELRGWENQILILSTDTALKPLLAAGIDPHFILTGDPSKANYLHLKGSSSKDALLVAEATSFPSALNEFEGRTITCIYENSSLRSLSDLMGNKGMLRAWGSVATMALDFALLLKCNPIIFIGQDLAHTEGRIYCSGLYFEEEWFAGIVDPDAWVEKLVRLRSDRRTVIVEDIFGQPVESTDKLTAYWNWFIKVFRDHPDVQFVNASEGGILRDHAAIVSLREALYRHCGQNLNLRERIRSAFVSAKESSLLYTGLNLETLIGEAAAVEDSLNLGFRLCETDTGHSAEELLKRLEAVKKSIYYNPRLAPLLDCFNQMGNVTFLRRRHNLSRQSHSSPPLMEIQNIYSDYFFSVREALNKITKVLLQIQANLKLEPKTEFQPTTYRSRRNRYSGKPRVTIS